MLKSRKPVTTMKSITNLSEVPEFAKESVQIRNETELLEKLNKLIKDGPDNLQIVTDFDFTLTRHQLDDGTTVRTSFGMFGACPSVPQGYKDEDKRLSDRYKPIECDEKLPLAEKTKHMVDWYIAGNNLLKGLKFPRNELVAVGKSMIDSFRIGVRELIELSEKKQVPVLVFSAGLGECVVSALEGSNLIRSNVKVVSNFLNIDADDVVRGIKGDIIHTLNKNETAIKHTEYYDMVKQRSNVLLMGDNIGDAKMADGMEHCDVVIKIGFLGKHLSCNLDNYLNIFDIVLFDESTMEVANAILKLTLGSFISKF